MATLPTKKPDYKLKVLNKVTNGRGEIGAAWINKDGSISIRLNPCTRLEDSEDLLITLFKNEPYQPPVKAEPYDEPRPTPDDGKSPF